MKIQDLQGRRAVFSRILMLQGKDRLRQVDVGQSDMGRADMERADMGRASEGVAKCRWTK